jgi:phosphatidate cytidylyltransferase
MSVAAALESEVFLRFLAIVGGLLVAAGLVLGALRIAGKDVASIRRTWIGWLVMAPLVMGAVLLGREAVIAGVALLAICGFKELARATGLYRDWWMTGAVYLGILAVAVCALVPDPGAAPQYAYGWYGLFIALPVYVVAGILLLPIARDRARGQLQAVALAILGFVYLGWMFGHLGFLANTRGAYGHLLFVVFATEVNDVAAFTCGRLFGRRKLRPAISPNKTVGGALGALAVALAMPFLLRFALPGFTAPELLLLGAIVGVGGQAGDLAISVIKRDVGVKDMGALVPGHGGILDRVDSLIFVAPVFFHVVRWLQGAG